MFELNWKEAGVIPTSVLVKWYDRIKSETKKLKIDTYWKHSKFAFEST